MQFANYFRHSIENRSNRYLQFLLEHEDVPHRRHLRPCWKCGEARHKIA